MFDKTPNDRENPEPGGVRPQAKGVSRTAKKVLWWSVALAILILLVADPLHVSPVGTWVRNLLGHHERRVASDVGARKGPRKILFYRNPMDPTITSPVPSKDEMGMDYVPVYADEASSPAPKAKRKILFYRNPMDPTITSPVPSKDEMGMDYVPVYADEASSPAPKAKHTILFYRNPMDPTITSPVPSKDEMGMDYVPVYADEANAAAAQGATVTIDPAVVQDMNLRTEIASRRDITRQIRTVGYLDYDQEKMVSVTTKYSGFLEKVYVNYIGQPVEKGQPLFEIYSPELIQTEQEILSGLEYIHRLQNAPEDAQRRARDLLAAARARLAYWDITPGQVARLEKTGEVFRQLTVVAPASGVVMKRLLGLEGMAVKPGVELLHIANISTLWLSVEIFEDQLPWVNLGTPATATFPFLPGETFRGRVRYIEPGLNEKTRSLRVTLELPNPGLRLRAGMYATVLFEPVVVRRALSVPTQSVLRTGERNVVVVALGGGQFTSRDVVLGPEGDGYVQVLKGLDVGDRVVTSAQFLIDSESNLHAAMQMMIDANKKKSAPGGGDAQ